MVPLQLREHPVSDLTSANEAAAPLVRRGQRCEAFGDPRDPGAAAGDRARAARRVAVAAARARSQTDHAKVDKLSCIRFASGRYSVPNRLIGRTVKGWSRAGCCGLSSRSPATCSPEHTLVAPGETTSLTTTTAVRLGHRRGPRTGH
jgi:hypothetical protein